mgnify:CR=1 FL=1
MRWMLSLVALLTVLVGNTSNSSKNKSNLK